MKGVEATTPMVAPFNAERPEHWKHFDDSVDAVSFGFVATAILISMFLLLAIFERFLRQRSSQGNVATPIDLEHQMNFGRKFENLSPKVHFNTLPLIHLLLVRLVHYDGENVTFFLPSFYFPCMLFYNNAVMAYDYDFLQDFECAWQQIHQLAKLTSYDVKPNIFNYSSCYVPWSS